MHLDEEDFHQLARLQGSLLRFVNEKTGIIPGHPDAVEIFGSGIEEKRELFLTLYDRPEETIDDYLAENPEQLPGDELDIIESWKALRHGRFIVFRQLNKYAVFINDKDRPEVFGVIGPTEPIADVVDAPLPVLVETTLLPFKGVIVYDGIMSRYAVHFGPGIRDSMNETYKAAKAGSGIITCLSPLGVPKKKPSAADRARSLARRLRDRLAKLREKRRILEEFESETLPAFETWVEKNHGDLRDRCDELQSEIDHLAELIDRAETHMMFGGERSGARAIAAAEEEIEDEEAVSESFARKRKTNRDGESSAGEDDDGDPFPGGPFGENPFEGMPDFMIDPLVCEFLSGVRGIDPSRLSDAEFEKARREFLGSFDHIASGDNAAFEKAMLRVGADESESNQNAVKKLFRKLASQVHPDRNPDFNEEAKEIWEELQKRKDALDLPSLELLEIKWRLIREDTFHSRDRKHLDRFKARLDEQEFDIEDALDEFSTHPMWGCRERTPPAKVRKQVKRDLEDAIAHFEEEAGDLKDQLERIRNRVPGPARKQSKKKRGAKRKRKGKANPTRKAAAKKKRKKQSPAADQKPPSKQSPPPRDGSDGFEQDLFDFQ